MTDKKSNPERTAIVHGCRIAGDVAVSGVAHVIRDDAELDKFREGEILVAAEILASWNHLFALAKGIIFESDDYPDYVAEAAREFDLPVINGVAGVTAELRSADLVMMHIDGSIEQLLDRRAPDSEMRVSVPAAVRARALAGTVGDTLSDDDEGKDDSVVMFPVQNHGQGAAKTADHNQPDLPRDATPRKMC